MSDTLTVTQYTVESRVLIGHLIPGEWEWRIKRVATIELATQQLNRLGGWCADRPSPPIEYRIVRETITTTREVVG